MISVARSVTSRVARSRLPMVAVMTPWVWVVGSPRVMSRVWARVWTSPRNEGDFAKLTPKVTASRVRSHLVVSD